MTEDLATRTAIGTIARLGLLAPTPKAKLDLGSEGAGRAVSRMLTVESLEQVFQNSPNAMALLRGSDLVIEHINAAYRAFVGDRDIVGKPVRAALPEVEGQGFFEMLDGVLATGQPVRLRRTPLMLASGPCGRLEQRYIDRTYQPIRDAAGTVVGVFAEGVDVTDLVRAEARLQADAERRAFLAELSDELRDLIEPQAIMFAAARKLGRHLGVGRCGYGEVDPTGEFLRVQRDWTDGDMQSLAGLHRLEDFGRDIVREFRAGLTSRIDDAANDPRTARDLAAYDRAGRLRAGLAAPLRREGRLAAALYAQQSAPRTWTEAEETLVRDVAERAWAAVERARVEAALRDSEHELRFALDAGGLGAWRLDLTEGLLTGAPAFRAAYGLPPGGPLSYEAWLTVLDPRDLDAWSDALALCVETGEDLNLEHRVRTPDGRTRWVSLRGRAVGGRLVGVCADVTKARESDARRLALIELTDRLRDLEHPADLSYAAAEILGRTLDVSRAGYGVIDRAAETIFIERDWNAPGVESLAGLLHFRDYGSYIDDLKRGETVVFDDAEQDPRTAATAQALKAISAQAVVNMPVTEHGGFVALLYLNHAKARHWAPAEIAFVREVAERTRAAIARREAEAELRGLTQTLERQVEARTAELLQAQDALRQAQKLEAMGQLTGGVAHDFNNLLTPIIGGLDTLQRRGIGGPREHRLIDGALQAADRAKTLVQRLLAFARRQPLQPQAVDLVQLLRGMEGLLASTVGPQVRLEVRAPDGPPPARADANQLEMALLNLAVNARDAMPDGGELIIAASLDPAPDRPDLAGGAYLRLSVSDTGLGMDAATLARAVEPFFSTKGIGKGTGLGLSMVHGLASQLGGALAIDSAPGEGTTVRLWLPLSEGAPEDAAAGSRRSGAPRPAAGRALLVDDEALVRVSTADMLTELGYVVTEAESAFEALDLLEAGETFDLVVTDDLMPGMTGAELARRVAAQRPGLPLLIVSGFAEAAGIAPDLPRLTKPFRQSDLAAMLAGLAPARVPV